MSATPWDDTPAPSIDGVLADLRLMPLMRHTQMELEAFAETRSRHDAGRLANALEHLERMPRTAAELRRLAAALE